MGGGKVMLCLGTTIHFWQKPLLRRPSVAALAALGSQVTCRENILAAPIHTRHISKSTILESVTL
jgi:hypothetical protein